jgi:hypothetical protein
MAEGNALKFNLVSNRILPRAVGKSEVPQSMLTESGFGRY